MLEALVGDSGDGTPDLANGFTELVQQSTSPVRERFAPSRQSIDDDDGALASSLPFLMPSNTV